MNSDLAASASAAVPRRSRRRKLLVACVSLVLGSLVVEIGTRVALASSGRSYDGAQVELQMSDLVATMNESVQTQGRDQRTTQVAQDETAITLHPYLAYDGSYRPDRIASELRYFADPKSKRMTDVMVLGGSVAAHFANNDGKAFVDELRKHPAFAQEPLRLFGEGRAGYKQPQQAIDLAYLLSVGYRPDIVVELDGFNEAALPSYNTLTGASPAHPSLTHWSHLAGNPTLDAKAMDLLVAMRMAQTSAKRDFELSSGLGLFRSAFTGSFLSRWIHRYQWRFSSAYDAYTTRLARGGGVTITGPPPPADYDASMGIALTVWKEASRSMAAMCRERGILYLHVLQPTLHDDGAKPMAPEELAFDKAPKGWIRGVKWAYPRYRDAGCELAGEGVEFLDASRIFQDVQEPLYYDLCHFTSAGNHQLAAVIAQRLSLLAEARVTGAGSAASAGSAGSPAAEAAPGTAGERGVPPRRRGRRKNPPPATSDTR